MLSLMHSVSHRGPCILQQHLLPPSDPLRGEKAEKAWLTYNVVVVVADFRLQRRATPWDPAIIEPKESRVEDVEDDDEMPDLVLMDEDSGCQCLICSNHHVKAKL
ncbi:hypothetical protein C8R44DRAFT_878910 [Mycena epipterygia]|nr:hypothetical protein C8R44DRAFT_878910 [Mycena epipterygia]